MVFVCSSFHDAEEIDQSDSRVIWRSVVQEGDGLSASIACWVNQGASCQSFLSTVYSVVHQFL